jgi:hypothetical protein
MQPSVRLISNAMEQQTTVLHVWDKSNASDSLYTQVAGFGWAYCTPFADLSGDRALYITGP